MCTPDRIRDGMACPRCGRARSPHHLAIVVVVTPAGVVLGCRGILELGRHGVRHGVEAAQAANAKGATVRARHGFGLGRVVHVVSLLDKMILDFLGMSSTISDVGKSKIPASEHRTIRRLRLRQRLTLAAIAQRYGVSRERIRQIVGNTGWSADYPGRNP